jgi:2-haloacid dehalogenase
MAASGDVRRPLVLLFDVNETLSDLSPMGDRFVEVGLPPHLAATWFAGLLRDGFAITATGRQASFKEIGSEVLRGLAAGVDGVQADEAIEQVLGAFTTLDLHPDVDEGLRSLHAAGIRMATLTNGAAAIPESILGRAGVADVMERFLSVDDAGIWKPHAGAYAYGVGQMGAEPVDTMLVAAHPWDIDGASRAGLATAHIDRKGLPYPAHFERADLQVPSLVALASALT